ncbi:hypothetical protein GGS23DRAFT_234770 [Durotheca rogersii]|uniref:uncharacterized protein n=1 Tax=Durotheca rogersii TaxID=419775 RepID=UPI0022207FE5|nr:uncharacterized protein GGS23DRAFT_234770 [Durotheca rogersii]KAI5860375.1 hypothetical protein GGS23DRAFT_234770 [Durotheca rogersii]
MAMAPHARSSLRRTACDRCRHSKLRCFRDENQERCARCIRLDLRCEIAPARPPGRPRKVVSSAALAGKSLATSASSSPQPPEPNTSQSSPSPDYHVTDIPGESPAASSVSDHRQQQQHHYEAISQIEGFSGHAAGGSTSISDNFHPDATFPASGFRGAEWLGPGFDHSTVPPGGDLLDVHNLFTAKLDRYECLKELSRLNEDLHHQWRVIREANDSGNIGFSTFIVHPPPPDGDGVSVAEKLLIMSQRFQQAITNLSWVVKNEPRSPLPRAAPPSGSVEDDFTLSALLDSASGLSLAAVGSPEHGAESQPGSPYDADRATTSDGQLDSPFVYALVSCYVLLINLWEAMFVHVRRRIERVDQEHIPLSDPSKGIQMGAFYIYSGRLQSMFFCQAVDYFMGNIDRGLGISAEQREQGVVGLLSHPRPFGLLQKELGGLGDNGESQRPAMLLREVEWARTRTLKDEGW